MDSGTEELFCQLGRLPDRKGQKAFLAQHPELVTFEIVRELAEAVRAALRVNVHRALELAQASRAIARELRHPVALALALRASANALWFQGDCREAVRLFRRATQLFEAAGRLDEVARTLSSSIQSLALLGEYAKAYQAAERAQELFRQLDEPWRVARVDINLANVYHRQNRYREALAIYERAYRELLPHRDMEGIGVALHNVAVCLIALDDFERALETYHRMRELCASHEMPLLAAQADYNIAFLHYLRGDYTKALDLLRSTREIYKENGDSYHTSLCDLDQSEIYLELRLIDEAADFARSSLEHFESLGMHYERARARINLAIALNAQGETEKALDLFSQAREITAGENNSVWPNLIDLYRALVLLEADTLDEVRALCLSAAAFFASVPMPTKHAFSLLVATRACLKMNDVESAALHCEEALRAIAAVDAPILRYEAHFLQGQVHEAGGESARAYQAYQDARAALETLRSSLQRQELKMGFMRTRLEVYSRLTFLCLGRGFDPLSKEEALSYIEAAKCRTLRDLILGGTQVDRFPQKETEFDVRVRNLRHELNWFYHRIERDQLSQEGVSPEAEAALRREARNREHELSRILLESPENATVAVALRTSSAASLKQIRSTLGKDAALLEYFAIADRIYVAAVTASRIEIRPLALQPLVVRSLRMLQFQISKFSLDSSYTTQFRELLLRTTQRHLRELHDALIAPVADLLDVRDLVIVPFGPLHSLAFHALFDGDKYLVDRYNICYQPSASLFTHSHRAVQNHGGSSLLLGIDDPKLPYIRDELLAVAAAVQQPRVLFGAEATEEALREYGHTSSLIHIASHGIFRQDNPLFSSIRLADSYLTLYDLYHMDLSVDLLTLSGCVTGQNVVEEGDELLGLTRGLLYAGARSLLLSLWEVEDRSTAEFMLEFYGGLAKKQRKADAVRNAMTAIRERYPHPYYWAPFKLTGHALAV